MEENTTQQENKTKILLVDDDKFLLDMYSLKFDKAGLAVSVAFSGAEALKKIKDNYTPEIILLDVVMPTMTGMDFLDNVRKEKLVDKATIILLTNNQGEEDTEKAKKLGADGYIIKAMSIPSDVVKQVLDIHKNKKR